MTVATMSSTARQSNTRAPLGQALRDAHQPNAPTPASVVLRGRTRTVRVEVVSDPAQAAEDLLTIVRGQHGYGRWAHVKIGPDGEPSRADAEAEVARGRRLLRLHLEADAPR